LLDIRVEWTKVRTRADRWWEELILLDEEMRCMLVFCLWKATWWEERCYARKGVSAELAEGLCAYATEQAARELSWASNWALKWGAVRARATLALADELVDVTLAVPLEVELEEEVAYGEYEGGEGEPDDDLLD
jgi:hypothetical protein